MAWPIASVCSAIKETAIDIYTSPDPMGMHDDALLIGAVGISPVCPM